MALTVAIGGAACRADRAVDGLEVAARVEEAPDQDEEWEDEVDGAYLYERNCSGCHGLTGAGDGQTAKDLGVFPRDFVEGGFSFGNTPESLFRTVSSGIPGRSVMPSFAGVLEDEEIRMIVDHVRTLMPPQEEQDTRASVMTVGEIPVVARGKLPPLAEGLPERPRGLLVGTPEGMTFEYDAEDVRLLGVRLGEFCDREDWRGRGGGYLRPLGQVVYAFAGGDPPGVAEVREDGLASQRARLKRTRVREDGVEIAFDLVDETGEARGSAVETCRFVGTSAGAALQREIVVGDSLDPRRFRFRLAGSVGARFERRLEVDERRAWEVAELPDGGFECVLVRLKGAVRVEGDEGIWVDAPAAGWRVITLEATVVLTADATPEHLAALAREIER